ncbi:hypothetical protein ACFQ1E_04010 [Sphingomonas canadensis]|uniref:Uncharacterized protein n=1 Tax=Sphingomonas canadensis TaxID=1219257 RepID=A0ABW3H2B2_9SPHN|nr:hypothetical protein [Sphingomonas canadensis]MCW3834591.1 hypothetical protein [Sphingomonas canadensis]
MRLIVHMGFHKTASTHLQALMNGNCEAMAARGIWYEHHRFAAHHDIANPLLVGDAGPFAAMLANAAAAGCHTVILSSENLEALPFNPGVAELIETTAAAGGADTIEWHAAIREPGAYFASIHSQLSWHTYADALHMFSEVMKKGVLFLPEPHHGEGATPYWFFCFDYQPFLESFAAPGRRLFVHDYADRDPYPGWRLMRRLGVFDVLVEQPEEWGFNHRLTQERAAKFFRERLREAAGDRATWHMVRKAVSEHLAANLAAVPAYAEAVGARYGASYRAALERFGRWDEDQGEARAA